METPPTGPIRLEPHDGPLEVLEPIPPDASSPPYEDDGPPIAGAATWGPPGPPFGPGGPHAVSYTHLTLPTTERV